MGILDMFSAPREALTSQQAISRFLAGDDDYPVETLSGANVSAETAMSLTTVYACVRLIAWTIASLPFPVYQSLSPRGKVRAKGHPLYKLLHDAPNPEMTSFTWRQITSVHQLLWGAGISEIVFDKSGNPVELWPIPPWRVRPIRTKINNRLAYEVRHKDNSVDYLFAEQVLVFPMLNTSIDSWQSPITIHRETIGAAMAVREFGARTFGQGTNPAAVIHTGKLGDNARRSLHESLKGYRGLSNAHRVMLLEEVEKFERIGLPPEDAQYLQTRQFDIAEIARIYSVPLHLLQDHEKSTTWGSGLEEMNTGFVTFTLRPYLVQWEQEINRRLIYDDEYFVEFLVDGLLRGKLTDRYAAYKIGRDGGWLSANDIREIENMNALPDEQGDVYLVPMNMQNAKFAAEKPEKSEPEAKPKEEDGKNE